MVKANTEDEEDININEILQVTSAEVDMPKTSSRIALIYDRASGEVIYEKKMVIEKQRWQVLQR